MIKYNIIDKIIRGYKCTNDEINEFVHTYEYSKIKRGKNEFISICKFIFNQEEYKYSVRWKYVYEQCKNSPKYIKVITKKYDQPNEILNDIPFDFQLLNGINQEIIDEMEFAEKYRREYIYKK